MRGLRSTLTMVVAGCMAAVPGFGQVVPAAAAPQLQINDPQAAVVKPGQVATPLPQQATPQAGAQQPDQQPTYTLPAVQVRLVDLVFTVTDKKGRFVTGLQQSNFGLLDDGYPPASVIAFKQLTDLPLRVGVMIDTSSSIRTRFKFEQEAAADFFLQVLHPADRAFVEGFDVQTQLTQDYTDNVSLLDTGIEKLRPGGGTALFDALYHTCRDQMLALKDASSVRKAIILVSDGVDNYSVSAMSDAIKMCQRAETIVYTISTDTSPSRGSGGDVLKAISDATGGQAFYPVQEEDVAQGFKNIETELRSQYSLEYRPSHFRQDGSFRTIRLEATDSRYHVRARTGYFAPRPGQ